MVAALVVGWSWDAEPFVAVLNHLNAKAGHEAAGHIDVGPADGHGGLNFQWGLGHRRGHEQGGEVLAANLRAPQREQTACETLGFDGQ